MRKKNRTSHFIDVLQSLEQNRMRVSNNQDLCFLSAGLTARETGRLWEKYRRVWRFCGHAPIEEEWRTRLTGEKDCTWEKTKWVTANEADKKSERETQPGGSVVVCENQTKSPCFNVKLLISDIVLSPLPAQHVHLASLYRSSSPL